MDTVALIQDHCRQMYMIGYRNQETAHIIEQGFINTLYEIRHLPVTYLCPEYER